MERPSYTDLQRQVKELQKIVDMKVYPQEIQFETRDLLYFRLDGEWHFELFDKRVCELTGYAREDLLNRAISWLDIVHPDDRQMVMDAREKGLQNESYYLVECRIVTKQGELKWVKMRGPIFSQHDGRLLFIQGILNDITTQKNMEMALESEHEIFVWVANCLDDGIYIVSHDYRILFMNDALIRLIGDHTGEVCYKALFGRDSVCPWSVMDTIRKEKCGFQEYHLPNLGRTYQVRSFPLKTRDGSIGKLGQLKDITETKKLRYEVAEFADRHQAIVQAANVADLGIFILQNQGQTEAKFRYANEALCRITGYTEQELLNKTIADLVPQDHAAEILKRYRNRQRGETITHAYELKLVRKDRTTISALFSVALSSHQGRVATIGFVRDITEIKRLQKSLEISQRLASIGKLAAEVAHEINNPLTSVLTFAKLVNRILQREPFPENRLADLRNFVNLLNSEASRCSEIARNLLDFSRQSEIVFSQTDVVAILTRTLDIIKHRTQLNKIEVVTSYEPEIPPILCDSKRLQQAFMNIFWNAIEAMPEGGRLSISAAHDGDRDVIKIDVEDTGTGIPEEHLEEIFEPFFTTKAEGKGVGLGLSVAYGIIRRHQGQIQAESALHRGTHFTITFQPSKGNWTDHNQDLQPNGCSHA